MEEGDVWKSRAEIVHMRAGNRPRVDAMVDRDEDPH
jgi:hypothetical protein